MAKLLESIKCPQCGNPMRLDPCGAITSRDYKTFCSHCTFSWRAANSEERAIELLNAMLEELRIGKEALAAIGPDMVYDRCKDYGDYVQIFLTDKPKPDTKDRVLEELRVEMEGRSKEYDVGSEPHKYYTDLAARIVAVTGEKV